MLANELPAITRGAQELLTTWSAFSAKVAKGTAAAAAAVAAPAAVIAPAAVLLRDSSRTEHIADIEALMTVASVKSDESLPL